MNQCVCRVFGIFLVVFLYTAFTVEGVNVAYGLACTDGTDTCIGTGTYACISSLCACAVTFFRNTDDDACLAKVALDATCAAGEPADQCTDSNAECTSTTCSCKATHFKDNGDACQTRIALNANCDTAQTATDQCAGSDVECRADSGTDKCLCKTTHFDSSGTCTNRLAFGAACSNTVTATNQCDLDGTECSLESGTTNYKCQCSAAYYDSGSSTCVARKKPDEACAAGQCVTDATCNTVDGSLKCECDTGFTATPAVSSTMCSGVAKLATLSYMYVVPILVSMMFLFR